jgi:hypothetical protein
LFGHVLVSPGPGVLPSDICYCRAGPRSSLQRGSALEFIISRLLKAVNVRCISVRADDPDKCRTGVALIPANESDRFAKFITLCEMSRMIVCATMFNPNMAREIGIAFGLERNREKFVYRSSDGKFHLGH